MLKLVAVLTTLAALAVATPAEGRSDMTNERGGWHDLTCPDRSFCLYDIPHGDSDALVIRSGFDGWHNLSSGWNNEAEAQKNTGAASAFWPVGRMAMGGGTAPSRTPRTRTSQTTRSATTTRPRSS